MKKAKVFLICLLFALLACLFALSVAADEPGSIIVGHNLSLDDSITMIYYVDFENVPNGAEKGLLIWTDAQETYTYGNEFRKLTENNGTYQSYLRYDLPGIAAKMMAQDIYAVPFIKDGEKITYGDLDKYSVLQYCYNKKGSNATANGGSGTLGQLVNQMLTYGANAQRYFNYRTDRLADATYYQITVVDGTLPDGTTKGLYQESETVVLTAATEINGIPFAYWKNSDGEAVSTTETVPVKLVKDETYTAVYVPYSKGLAFTSNGDGTCYVAGIGTCTDTDIVIPSTSPEGKRVTSIGDNAFQYCRGLTNITIPDSVTSIGSAAFEGCSSLTSITIPDSVTSIGHGAFYNCSSLTSITIGNGVTSIGSDAFICCSSLTSITIPESVTSIGNDAFFYCSSLTSVNWNATNCTSAGSYDFPIFHKTTNLKTVNIGDNVTIIPSHVFRDCSSLTSVTIGNGVTSIGNYAFYKCSGLTSVYITDLAAWCNISFGGYDASPLCYAHNLYLNGTLVTDLVIPENVTSIGNYAFYECSSLTSITIPDSVTSIGYRAFQYCRGLTNITIPDSVTSIGSAAFEGCSSLTSITIPDSVTSIGDGAFYNCSSLTSITIPGSVTSIGNHAFNSCTALKSITIPDSVTSIGINSFYNCRSLTSVTIGNGVPSIGIDAFRDCRGLTSVYITDLAAWCKISFGDSDANPLSYAHNLYLNGTLVTDLVIPDSITSIEEHAFRNCSSLTSITIPNSVTSIGDYAFSGYSGLTSITYQGTKTQWNAISKESNWNGYTGNYTIHCTDGDITK